MKTIILLCAALFSLPSFAQTCDVTWRFALTHKGESVIENIRILRGLDQGDFAQTQKRGVRALNAVVKDQDKGGDYVMTLGQDTTCAAPSGTLPSIELRGAVRENQ